MKPLTALALFLAGAFLLTRDVVADRLTGHRFCDQVCVRCGAEETW